MLGSDIAYVIRIGGDEILLLANVILLTIIGIIRSVADRFIIIYISQMEPQVINVQTFAAKFRSKREVYTFLTVDGNVYLPAYETVTVYFLKAILAGTK